jgi:hypothetical protein
MMNMNGTPVVNHLRNLEINRIIKSQFLSAKKKLTTAESTYWQSAAESTSESTYWQSATESTTKST